MGKEFLGHRVRIDRVRPGSGASDQRSPGQLPDAAGRRTGVRISRIDGWCAAIMKKSATTRFATMAEIPQGRSYLWPPVSRDLPKHLPGYRRHG